MEWLMAHWLEINARHVDRLVSGLRTIMISGSLILALLPSGTVSVAEAHGTLPPVGMWGRPEAMAAPAVCDDFCRGKRDAFISRVWTYARKPGQTYDYRMCNPNTRNAEGAACRAIGLVICDGVSVGVATIVRQPGVYSGRGPDVMIGAGHSFVNDTTGERRRNCYFAPNGAKNRAYPISYVRIGPLTKNARGQVVSGDYAVGVVDGGVGSERGAIGYWALPPTRLTQLIAQDTKFRQLGFLPRLGQFVISDNGLPLNQTAPQLGATERDQYRHSFNTVVGFSGGPQTIEFQGVNSVYCVQVKMLTHNGDNQDNRPFDALINPSACTRIDGALKSDIERAFDFVRTGRAKAGSFERMVFRTAR